MITAAFPQSLAGGRRGGRGTTAEADPLGKGVVGRLMEGGRYTEVLPEDGRLEWGEVEVSGHQVAHGFGDRALSG